VEAAERDVVLDLQRAERTQQRKWWQVWRRRPPDDDTFRLSSR
jgi:hypothetical protein